ncbi:MAG: fatty acid desaturase [Planctomycetota bacterium]
MTTLPASRIEPSPPSNTDPPGAPGAQPDALVAAEQAFEETGEGRAPIKIRVVNLFAVTIPFAGFLAACILLWGVAFNWAFLALMMGMYVITGLGITIGYHRLFCHRSFKAPPPVVALFAIMGSMALQGPLLQWVAVHRRHHRHSDHEHDPHSPHGHGEGFLDMIKGFWHAHLGWVITSYRFTPTKEEKLTEKHELKRAVKDLLKDPLIRWMNHTHAVWLILGMALPALIGYWITGTGYGALLGFLWGGLARACFQHHMTWSINSVCHIWGTRPFQSQDHSRNNPIFGLLAFGEGWHNNHHAFPTSARHGLRWWEFDMSYLVIKAMEKVGLASDVRVPSKSGMDSKRRQIATA